jgi:type I restriction enzyme S subunit
MKHNKIKSDFISQKIRFNASYFLNDDALNSYKIEKFKTKCVQLFEIAEVYNPPIFKRQFCQKSDNAVQYCQSSDVTNLLEGSAVFINKKQAEKVGSIVRINQILVTGFGTIGNTKLVNELSEGISYANNVCRIEASSNIPYGYIYAFMSSKYGKSQLNKNSSGSVVRYIEAPGVKKTFIPIVSDIKLFESHNLILESSNLRVEANKMLNEVNKKIKKQLSLNDLNNSEYESFGNSNCNRKVSTFSRNINELNLETINAFNYSKKIELLRKKFSGSNSRSLLSCLDEKGLFSTGSFKRLETVSDKGIMLINQSDIFNSKIIGKNISRKFIGNSKLVDYGEVIIAGVGTLGEGETFCRVIFANELIENQLVSGEFIRMKTNVDIPSGYLFALLSSDYGFRIIRSTQSGTKLCRPISRLLEQIPIPILSKEEMDNIDFTVKKAHTNYYLSAIKENQAIDLIEKEIDAWQ